MAADVPMMTTAEIRSAFLKFFEERGCKLFPSSSLVPDDPSLLLANAGMNQFKQYYQGKKTMKEIGATSCQKCVRTNDIDIIGFRRPPCLVLRDASEISRSAEFQKSRRAPGLSNFPPRYSICLSSASISPCSRTTTRRMGSGARSASRKAISRVSARTITSGQPAPPARAAPALRSITTWARMWAAAVRTALPDAIAIAFSSTGTSCSRSSTARRTAPCRNSPHRNLDTGMGLERMSAIMQGKTSFFDSDIMQGAHQAR